VATVEFTELGPLGLMVMKQPAIDGERAPVHIRRFDPETYHLVPNLSGRQVIAQERNEATPAPGDMTLYTSSRPFQSRSSVGDGREHAIVLVLPAHLLPYRPDAMRDLLAVPFGQRDGMNELVSQHLRTLAPTVDQFDLGLVRCGPDGRCR
jgi:hypothetical protein